jgi:phosphatidylserine/phosphatidylglycerophosphate/cardiolipin synthase-like enzyme
MEELLSDNLWTTIKRLARKSSVKRAAVAYVTSEGFITFADGDVLITDASDHAIASGDTNAKVLARAFRRGAELYSLPRLHTKVLLLGGTAVIGSANLSQASANSLVEAAWVTNAPAAVGMATSFIQKLIDQAEAIDEKFVNRILKIKVLARPRPVGGSVKPKKVSVPKHRTWIIGTHELIKDFPDEQEAIEAGTEAAEEKVTKSSSDVSWIRWTGKSSFRREAKEGDTVIRI